MALYLIANPYGMYVRVETPLNLVQAASKMVEGADIVVNLTTGEILKNRFGPVTAEDRDASKGFR